MAVPEVTELDLSSDGCYDLDDKNVVVDDFSLVASYNWLDRAEPTILVPGTPPIWNPPAAAPVLKPDSGARYVDQNADRNPRSPIEPLICAVKTLNLDFDFTIIDIISDRRPLSRLLGLAQGKRDPFQFGIEVVGKTAVFVRMEEQTRDEIAPGKFQGYRRAFEEAYTKLALSAKGSTSHHRIVQYSLGGLKLLVRSAADAYVVGPDTNTGEHGRTDTTDLVGYLKAVSLAKPSPRASDPEVSRGLTVENGGTLVPQESVLEFTTRSAFSKRPFDMQAKLPELWLAQTSNFVLATYRNAHQKWENKHQRGVFDEPRVKSIKQQLLDWEKDNAVVIRNFHAILRQVISAARDSTLDSDTEGRYVLRYNGEKAKVHLEVVDAGFPALPDEMKRVLLLA